MDYYTHSYGSYTVEQKGEDYEFTVNMPSNSDITGNYLEKQCNRLNSFIRKHFITAKGVRDCSDKLLKKRVLSRQSQKLSDIHRINSSNSPSDLKEITEMVDGLNKKVLQHEDFLKQFINYRDINFSTSVGVGLLLTALIPPWYLGAVVGTGVGYGLYRFLSSDKDNTKAVFFRYHLKPSLIVDHEDSPSDLVSSIPDLLYVSEGLSARFAVKRRELADICKELSDVLS